MALVKISKQLLEDAEKHVRQMDYVAAAAGHEAAAPAKNMAVVAELAELAMTEWFSKAPEIRKLVPLDWLVETNRIYIEVRPTGGKGGNDMRVVLEGAWRIPQFVKPSYADPTFRVSVASLTYETRDCVTSYYERMFAHDKKYLEVRKQVKAFLTAAVSLNDAVKRFPSIAMYIPQSYLDKLKEQKAKSSKKDDNAAAEAALDKTLLSVVGALHQLGS